MERLAEALLSCCWAKGCCDRHHIGRTGQAVTIQIA